MPEQIYFWLLALNVGDRHKKTAFQAKSGFE
jgi:hypothetical protein